MSRSSFDDAVSSSPEPKEDATAHGVQTPKARKRKELISEIMDLDNFEEQPHDTVVICDKFDARNKGKEIKLHSDDFGYCQPKASFFNHTKMNGVALHSPVSDIANENLYSDKWFENSSGDLDHFKMLEAHFDSMDFPSGVEADVPWYPALAQVGGNASFFSSLCPGIEDSIATPPLLSPKPAVLNEDPIPHGDLNWQVKDLSSESQPFHSSQSKNKMVGLGSSSSLSDGSAKMTSLKNLIASLNAAKSNLGASLSSESQPFKSKNKLLGSSSSHYYDNKMKTLKVLMASINSSGTSNSGHMGEQHDDFSQDFPPDLISLFQDVCPHQTWFGTPIEKSTYDPFGVHISSQDEVIDFAEDTHTYQCSIDEDDIQRKFQLFKQFDTAEDHSDHHYDSKHSTTQQPPKQWAKTIQDEWRILEKDLPDTIFVRVYESRMDILRAAIIGAEGTPYHDGLFFFDVFFPDAYPNVPPLVYFHSGGLRLNPNLYNNGKVCLSLLNTWSGDQNEKWIPGTSTMLQVLVSIQALILNKDPFFNEPGYERMRGSLSGEAESQEYSEGAFISSLKIMLYTMRRSPKHFEHLVVGHFYGRAHDILAACNAYFEGARVCSLVKGGGVQDVDDAGNKSCSLRFRNSLKDIVKLLVKEFSKIGAKDCDKFLIPETKPLVESCKAANQAATPEEILD